MPGLLYSMPLTPRDVTANPCVCRRHLDAHRQVWLSLLWGHCSFLLGPGAHKVLYEPSEHLWRLWALILNVISPLLLSCWGFSFALGCGVSFFGGIQRCPVDGSLVTCSFGVLTGEDECTSCHSAILWIT